MLRLKQLEDAFKTGLKTEVPFDDEKAGIVDQHADLVVATGGEIYLIQTIVKKKNPWIYIRAPEREGKDEKTNEEKENSKSALRFSIQANEEEHPWNTLVDPQAKLWV